MEFRRKRSPTAAAELTAVDSDQVVIVGRAFDGCDRSAESRFRHEPTDAPDGDDDGNLRAHLLVVYDAWENGAHAYDVWIHHAGDNGCVFEAGTTNVVAGRCQSAWLTPDLMQASPLAEALTGAERALRAAPTV